MNERFQESPLERRARYLRLAREAKELAVRSKTTQMREACLAMAQSWLGLAAEMDIGQTESTGEWVPPAFDGAERSNALENRGAADEDDIPSLLPSRATVSHEPSPRGD
jgi:hypothetical protein